MLFFLATLWCVSAASADSVLVVRVVDEQGESMPARAWVTINGTRMFVPSAPASATPYRQDRSFSFDGKFTMNLSPGDAIIHVERGKEYRPVDQSVTISEGATTEQEIVLSRWIDMPSKGWFSVDMHLHLGSDNPALLKQLALADDVHLLPSFTYWLRGTESSWAASWPDDSFTQPMRVDDQHIVTRNNIEIERIANTAVPGGAVGATFLYHLNQPVTATSFGEHYPTDTDLCINARRHSPSVVFDSDKPSWAETVVGAALGVLDTIQLCHNHYHRDGTLNGGWGMIGPIVAGESNTAANDGLFHRTNALYYRLLNCGFRLGVSGGSAIGVMPVPAGFHRVYAEVDGPMTVRSVWDAVKNGRSFATTGPMLFLSVDDQPIGSTLSIVSGDDRMLPIITSVESIEPLESLDLIHNGKVVASRDLRAETVNKKLAVDLTHNLRPARSGWIAARATYRAPDGLLRQAHTSPIYLSVDALPIAYEEDARYMLAWIAQLTAIARESDDRFPSSSELNQVLKTYELAADRYREILRTALAD